MPKKSLNTTTEQNETMVYNQIYFFSLTNASKSDFYSLYSSVYPSRVWDI